MRNKLPVSSLVQIAIPLFLLGIFTLCICFPDYVPFLQVHPKSYVGVGTETFSLKGEGFGTPTVKFALKRVPAGVAPAGCVDVPGGTVVKDPFMLAETEVTVALWDRVVKLSASKGYDLAVKKHAAPNPRYPVEAVSWREAIVWCNALSESLSLDPAYYADSGMKEPVRGVAALEAIGDEPFVKANARGFRLPSASEWELAARYIDGAHWTAGGSPSGSDKLYFDGSYVTGYAIFMTDRPERVKSKSSNRLGIYDMSGNVWEWCFDRFSEAPDDPIAHGKRVVRGGSWSSNAYRLQIGGKFGTAPDAIERGQGFRIARSGW